MNTYVVRTGDTFESISSSQFGTVDSAADILAANPGVTNPPTPDTTIFIPRILIPESPSNIESGQLSVVINDVPFLGWTEISFAREMDSFGTFNLLSVWEPDNKEFRDVFRPFGYQSVAIFEGSELLFHGTLIDVAPSQSAKSRVVNAAGYSVPGVINDCTPPVSAFPLERDAQNLKQIATELLAPFGIPVEVDGDSGATFEREAVEPTTKILDYLIKLAGQRNLIITDTPEGACKFQTETEQGNPMAVLSEGQPGITSISPQFNPQDYYSHISGPGFTLFSTPGSVPGSVFTVPNERLIGTLRPLTFTIPDAIGGEIKLAVEAKAGRMFANTVAYRAVIPSWRNPDGKLWRPNTTIIITAPGAMIYSPFEFLIRRVQYTRDATEESVELTLILPGSFKGAIPEALPWDE